MSAKAALTFFVTRVTQSAGLYTALTGIFFYHAIFDKDFECTCEDPASPCWSYMILPASVILVMLLWLDGSFQALLKYSCLNCTRCICGSCQAIHKCTFLKGTRQVSWSSLDAHKYTRLKGTGTFDGSSEALHKYCCPKGTCRFCCFLLLWFFRAFLICLLWPISVMMDGDWYTCYYIDKKLYCGGLNLTADGERIMKKLKNTSRIIGFGALLVIILVASILRCVPWRECCTRLKEHCTCLKKCCTDESNEPTANSESKCFSKDDLFKMMVLEVGENLVTDKLIEVVKGKIHQKTNSYVNNKQWGKCYDVVEEIIEELSQHDNPTNPNPPPGGSPSAEEGRNDDEIELMVQRLIHGSPSGSSPNEATSSV